MRLLIVTQAVDLDDPVLGFFHRWIEEFATRCERVAVICLKEGRHTLPKNVSVYSLGKEKGSSRMKYLTRFYRYIWRFRGEYDFVFVHMNPEYLALGGMLWRLTGKRVALWYVHRSVTWYLRAAVRLASVVFTATKESMLVSTKKLRVVGHGIDMELFSPVAHRREGTYIVSVGRLSPVKHCEVLIETVALLRKKNIALDVTFVGPADDHAYAEKLKVRIRVLGLGDSIRFQGPVPYLSLPAIYRSASATVNLAATGGSDKVVLESLACAVPAFVCNRAFASLYGEYADTFIFEEHNPIDLANKIERFLSTDTTAAISAISGRVREHFDLRVLIRTIMQAL